jgi:hypothetical protein
MRLDAIRAIKTFFEKLAEGNIVAWCFVLGFVVLGVIAVLVIRRISAAHKREDEERNKRWLKKKKL